MKESGFRFVDPRLVKLDYSLCADHKLNEATHFQNNFRIAINRTADANEAIVELTLIIGETGNSKNIPYTVMAVIGSKFTWSDEYSEEIINKLLSINAPALLLSYVRPIISGVTNASGMEAFNIPFIDFTSSAPEEKELADKENN